FYPWRGFEYPRVRDALDRVFQRHDRNGGASRLSSREPTRVQHRWGKCAGGVVGGGPRGGRHRKPACPRVAATRTANNTPNGREGRKADVREGIRWNYDHDLVGFNGARRVQCVDQDWLAAQVRP